MSGGGRSANLYARQSELKEKPRAILSPMENLVVGAVGGTVETTIQMPILTWKFCSQEGRPMPKTVSGMFRGVGIQAGMVAPITAVQMFANGLLEKAAGAETRKLSSLEVMACASGAGVISSLIYSPVDLVMIQQQKLTKDPLSTIKHISSNHGVATIWRGFCSCAVREAIYTAGYLGLAPILAKKLKEEKGWSDASSALVGAVVAGVASAVATHPVDTAKTVFQADLAGTRFQSATSAARHLYAEGGVMAFYKGGLARTIRLCGAFFIVGALREYCIQHKTDRALQE